jgi:hypothetical protein
VVPVLLLVLVPPRVGMQSIGENRSGVRWYSLAHPQARRGAAPAVAYRFHLPPSAAAAAAAGLATRQTHHTPPPEE